MSVTINIHDPAFSGHLYEAREDRPPFATVQITGAGFKAEVFLHDPAKCDELIKAACAAKDMLAAAGHAAVMTDPLAPLLPDRGRYDAAPGQASQCAAAWGAGSGEAPMLRELTAGHAGCHENGGIAWGPVLDDDADAIA